MLRLIRLVTIGLTLAIGVQVVAKERTWTDKTGRTMQAEFVRELDGEVTLLRSGKLLTLSLDTLSERDQQIARDLGAGKEVPDDPPPPPAADPTPSPAAEPKPSAPQPTPAETPAPVEPAPLAAEPAPPEAAPKPLVNKPAPIVNRVWHGSKGEQVTAKFVRIFDGKVVLSRAGRAVTISYYEMSQADQDYVKELLTSRGEEQLIPPRPPATEQNNPSTPANVGLPPFFAPPPPPAMPDTSGIIADMNRRRDEMKAQRDAENQRMREEFERSEAAYKAEREQRAEKKRIEEEKRQEEYRQRQEERRLASERSTTDTFDLGRKLNESFAQSRAENEVIGECGKCKWPVLAKEYAKGDHVCPHCGIKWTYERQDDGTKINYVTGKVTAPPEMPKFIRDMPPVMFLSIFALVVVLGVIGAGVAVILAIVRGVSSPPPPAQQPFSRY